MRCDCGRYLSLDGKPCHCAGWVERARYAVKRLAVEIRRARIRRRMRREVWHG